MIADEQALKTYGQSVNQDGKVRLACVCPRPIRRQAQPQSRNTRLVNRIGLEDAGDALVWLTVSNPGHVKQLERCEPRTWT